MTEGLDLTQTAFLELLHTFKCVHSVSLFDNAMVVTCVTPAGIIIYSIYEVDGQTKVLRQPFFNNQPLEPNETDLDTYLEICNLLIDDFSALDGVIELAEALEEALEESDNE